MPGKRDPGRAGRRAECGVDADAGGRDKLVAAIDERQRAPFPRRHAGVLQDRLERAPRPGGGEVTALTAHTRADAHRRLREALRVEAVAIHAGGDQTAVRQHELGIKVPGHIEERRRLRMNGDAAAMNAELDAAMRETDIGVAARTAELLDHRRAPRPWRRRQDAMAART